MLKQIPGLSKACGKDTSGHQVTMCPRSLIYGTGRMWSTAADAKSLQSCPTLCNPIDGSPPGSSVSGILQARLLEWVAISFSNVEYSGLQFEHNTAFIYQTSQSWSQAVQIQHSILASEKLLCSLRRSLPLKPGILMTRRPANQDGRLLLQYIGHFSDLKGVICESCLDITSVVWHLCGCQKMKELNICCYIENEKQKNSLW